MNREIFIKILRFIRRSNGQSIFYRKSFLTMCFLYSASRTSSGTISETNQTRLDELRFVLTCGDKDPDILFVRCCDGDTGTCQQSQPAGMLIYVVGYVNVYITRKVPLVSHSSSSFSIHILRGREKEKEREGEEREREREKSHEHQWHECPQGVWRTSTTYRTLYPRGIIRALHQLDRPFLLPFSLGTTLLTP